MEGSPITHESNVMQFCVIAIQTAARKMNITAAELTQRLEAQGLIDGRMTPEMAMGELIKEDLRHQVCILNQEIIDRYITFVESIEI